MRTWKNDKANLPDCLGGLQDLFDEIDVIDTGSADRTYQVAAALGVRVFDFPWQDSFAAARNESLDRATGDWIFWLDADDRLDEENHRKLRELFASLRDENTAYVMKCLCPAAPGSDSGTTVDHIRLFRNRPNLRWKYRVHEQILGALRAAQTHVRWADVLIRHVGYQDPTLRHRKLGRDLHLLHLDMQERPDDPFLLFNLGSVYQEMGRPAEALSLLEPGPITP
jgi:glycosyltransferase involved in cell wall biosynthesis